jgi:hypothetical protein
LLTLSFFGLGKAAAFLGKGFLFLAKTMLLNPIGWLVAGVAILIKGFMDLRNGNDTLAASFASSFQSIFDAAKNLVSSLSAVIRSFIGLRSILQPILDIFLIPTRLTLTAIAIAFDFVTIAINELVIRLTMFSRRTKEAGNETGLFTGILNSLGKGISFVTGLLER